MKIRLGIDIGACGARCAAADGGRVQVVQHRDVAQLSRAETLKILREDAEAQFGVFIEDCSLCVPAFFGSPERREAENAARGAGFTEDVSIIDEPVAAAIASGCADGEKILVLDWGANADVSVVENLRTLETVRVEKAGGRDFTEALADWLVSRVGAGADMKAQFLSEAEQIKIALSSCESYEWIKKIERSDLDRLIRFHIKRVAHCVEDLRERHKTEKFVLLGGCAKIPLIRETFNSTVPANENFLATGAAKFSPPIAKSDDNDKKTDEANLRARLSTMSNISQTQRDNLSDLITKSNGNPELLEIVEKAITDIDQY